MTMVLLAAAWIAGNYVPPAEEDYRAFFEDAPAPVLKRTFDLTGDAKAATWRIAAAGMLDASVNGTRVTPTALPAWTDYDRRILSYDYGVTHLLAKGSNVLELRLGNGWYNPLPMRMWGMFNLRDELPTGMPCVNAELECNGDRPRIFDHGF